LGDAARAWLEWMHQAGCGMWQFLPLGPAGPGWSPYQSPSTFAGHPLLISLEDLVAQGWLLRTDVEDVPVSTEHVDFALVHRYKTTRLARAADRWRSLGQPDGQAFEAWCESHRAWVDDFALFMALKEAHDGAPWMDWEPDLARRRPAALSRSRRAWATEIENHALQQFWFWSQWNALHGRAAELGIRLVGDLPIYVALDSADVWANPDLFQLDDDGRPLVVAGVPPDYFSATGQLWSNPIYRWERHRQDGFLWWIERVRQLAQHVEIVRIDHFRGLEAYWEVPADSPTAATGRWVPGPGADLLEALRNALGGLPFIAEDLGVITPGVQELVEAFDLPGMKVLQFGLEGGESEGELPQAYPEQCVAYTGTHDNNTSRGWFEEASKPIRDFARRALSTDGNDIAWSMIRAIWESPARWALAPAQDLLSLGGEARMNYPGRAEGNWTWRMGQGVVNAELAGRLRALNEEHGRARSGQW
jgi:4-alpha-glucanotransferase